MTASTDSIASTIQKIARQMPLALAGLLLILCLGCGNAEWGSTSKTELPGIDPQSITLRGKLRFVDDFAVGRKLSIELGKPCLLFFTADWCTYCRQMEESAFTDSAVRDLSNNFICVIIDADDYPAICQEFSVTGFPTIQFVSANGQALNRLEGRQSAVNLAQGMQSALKRFAWLNDPETLVR